MDDTEKYTDRDILIRIAESHEKMVNHFSNGKFVGQLKEGIKEQTKTLLNETSGIKDGIEETRNVQNWIRYTAFGIIGALITANLGLLGLYAKQLLLAK